MMLLTHCFRCNTSIRWSSFCEALSTAYQLVWTSLREHTHSTSFVKWIYYLQIGARDNRSLGFTVSHPPRLLGQLVPWPWVNQWHLSWGTGESSLPRVLYHRGNQLCLASVWKVILLPGGLTQSMGCSSQLPLSQVIALPAHLTVILENCKWKSGKN